MRKVAGRAVREHGHLPCPSSAQDISVEEAHNLRRIGYLLLKSTGGSRPRGKVPATVASPAQGTEAVARCLLLKEHVSLDS